MKLYEVNFSFEYPEGGYSCLYPSLREAVNGAKQRLQEERKANLERFGMESIPNTVTAEISEVTVGKITKQMFCDVINSNGGQFVQSSKPVADVTLQPDWKRPKVVRR